MRHPAVLRRPWLWIAVTLVGWLAVYGAASAAVNVVHVLWPEPAIDGCVSLPPDIMDMIDGKVPPR